MIAAECAEIEPCPGHPKGNVVLGTAAAMVLASTIWDLVTADYEALRSNKLRHRAPLAIVPNVSTTEAGVSLSGVF